MKTPVVNWDTDQEREIWRGICSPNSWFDDDGNTTTHPESLYWFVRLAWGTDFYFKKHPEQARWFIDLLHKPYLGWLQYHLTDWQKSCLAGGKDRKYIACILPRGYGKSVTTTKAASIWLHLNEPDMSTLLCSGTGALSFDFLRSIKAVLSGTDEDSWFSWLYGDWKKGADKWSGEIVVHGYRRTLTLSESSFDITSVDVGMTGYHHRAHFWDDPIIGNKRREGKDAYDRAVHQAVNASYNALASNGLFALVLTRYYDDDVAGRHLREEGVNTWSGMDCPNTVMFDKVPFGKGVWHVYFLQTEDELTGEPTHPILWTKDDIARAKRRDPEDFACQQQNNPGTGERSPLVESQLKDIFVDYKEFRFNVPIEGVSVHIDTAFKTLKTVRTGDDSAIVPWFHDARRNGIVYLDTDNMKASNEWREEDFNDELVRILIRYRRDAVLLKVLTDEVEPGGKAGTYKNRILSILAQAGCPIASSKFKQINRTTNKEARIRSSLGYWAEGYVRILLHKDAQGEWIIPPVVRKFFNQILRIDVVSHKDLADAATDVFVPGIWIKPQQQYLTAQDEGTYVRMPGDEGLKAFERPLSTQEVYELIDVDKEFKNTLGPGHGWDDRYEDLYEDQEFVSPRDPV